MKERTLTLALMDPPYESGNSTTAFRIIHAALEQGINVNVFAYEGAVCLSLKDQAPHANQRCAERQSGDERGFNHRTTHGARAGPDELRLGAFAPSRSLGARLYRQLDDLGEV